MYFALLLLASVPPVATYDGHHLFCNSPCEVVRDGVVLFHSDRAVMIDFEALEPVSVRAVL